MPNNVTKFRVLACAFTCCPSGQPGFTGGEDILGWNLLKQISRFHEVYALTHSDDRQSIERALKEQPIPNLHFRYVDLPRWLHPLLRLQGSHQLYAYLWQLRAYFTAIKLHRELRFDLFHHITYANDWMTSFIGAWLPVPYVRGPGGGAHRTPKGFETEYSLKGRIWEKFRGPGQWLFRHDPFFTRGQVRAKALLVCNKEAQLGISRRLAKKVYLFPVSGVSSEDLAIQPESNGRKKHFRVLSAGALIRVKGFGIAIKAFKLFVDKHPDATFSIIGSGPEGPRLKALVQDAQIEQKVEFLQWVPRDTLLKEMRGYDVFLFPSLRDGGGTVVIEAMSAAKPVVCLDVGGPGTHISDDCGIKVTPDSPQHAIEQLADALERLYLDEELRLRLGRGAREKAEKVYLWERLGEQLMNIYRDALNRTINDQSHS